MDFYEYTQIPRTARKELDNSGSSVVEEAMSNFMSWYADLRLFGGAMSVLPGGGAMRACVEVVGLSYSKQIQIHAFGA